jgi:PAS domain S-box-containing protein
MAAVRHTLRSPVFLLLVAGTVLVALDAAWLTFGFGGQIVTSAVDGACLWVAAIAATALTAGRARSTRERTERLGWSLLSASTALFLLGDAVIAVVTIGAHAMAAPFPSAGDPVMLLAIGLLPVAVLLLSGQIWISSHLRLLLDGGMVTAALLLLAWLTTMERIYASGGASGLSVLVSLAYCGGYVATTVIVLASIANSPQIQPSLLMIALGMLGFVASNSAFLYLEPLAEQNGASLIDVGTLAGFWLIAAASRVRPQSSAAAPGLRRWQVLLPYAVLALATLPVAEIVLEGQALDGFSEALLAVVVALVLARQLTAVVESQSLANRLATAVASLRRTSAEREVVIERAPAGICQLDREGQVTAANPALHGMLGAPPGGLVGRTLVGMVAGEDREREAAAYAELASGRRALLSLECRLVRADGSLGWFSMVAAPVPGAGGLPESAIVVIEDVSDRRQEAERAAFIQRQLLPQATPTVAGYELAGACRPARDVAGDFYDWVLTESGCLDLTVADVMGKGVPAALVMAVVRTALRATPSTLGPAAKVRAAADSISAGMSADGLFVTLFQARLEPTTGVLRFVDAGHGYCGIRHPDGRVALLPSRSLPIGVLDRPRFTEHVTRLSPGDALIVYSDGLVESDERTLSLDDFGSDLDAAAGASDMVGRLLRRTPVPPPDDVTVVALLRAPLAPAGAPGASHAGKSATGAP